MAKYRGKPENINHINNPHSPYHQVRWGVLTKMEDAPKWEEGELDDAECVKFVMKGRRLGVPEKEIQRQVDLLWFGEQGSRGRERAKEACEVCVVREKCLEVAMSLPDEVAGNAGIWGGMSFSERQKVKNRRKGKGKE